MEISLIDFHNHLTFFDTSDALEIIESLKTSEVSVSIQGGYESTEWKRQAELKQKCQTSVYTCFGLHPWFVINECDKVLTRDFKILQTELTHADFMGEVGLDRSHNSFKSPEVWEKQLKYLDLQLELNRTHNKPLVIHEIRAHENLIPSLKRYNYRGFVHRFTGDYSKALKYIDMGYMISISPDIKNLKKQSLQDVVKKIDLKYICVETDSPSKVGSPKNDFDYGLLREVMLIICDMKNINFEDLEQQLKINFWSLLGK